MLFVENSDVDEDKNELHSVALSNNSWKLDSFIFSWIFLIKIYKKINAMKKQLFSYQIIYFLL